MTPFRRAILVACAATLAGCQPTMDAVDAGGNRTRSLIGSVDPTGVIKETDKRSRLWEAARSRFEEVDVVRLNETINALGDAVRRLDQVIADFDVQLVDEVSDSVQELLLVAREQVRGARLVEVADAGVAVLDDAGRRVQAVDTEKIAAIVSDVAESATRLHEVIDALDGRLASVATSAQSLSDMAARRVGELPIDETRGALLQLRSAIDEIGVVAGHVRRATAPLPAASTELESALRWARTMLITATGVLTIAGVSLLAWLFRRGPRGSPSA